MTAPESLTVEPLTVEPLTVEPLTVEPLTVEPLTVEPLTVEPAPSGGSWGPTAVYESGLRSVDGRLWARHADGRRDLLPVRRWRGALGPGDDSLLDRCVGPTLDVGCGPGRLAAALTARGTPALGIDVAPVAVRLTRQAGASALLRDVFDRLPGEGRWGTVLLADGNIGIGGDPTRLLRRAAALLDPAGQVLAELEPPGTPTGPTRIRLEDGDGRQSRYFPWYLVGPDEIGPLAAEADLAVLSIWPRAGRLFARLAPVPVPVPPAPPARLAGPLSRIVESGARI